MGTIYIYIVIVLVNNVNGICLYFNFYYHILGILFLLEIFSKYLWLKQIKNKDTKIF
jgi:hypothetical protein